MSYEPCGHNGKQFTLFNHDSGMNQVSSSSSLATVV